MINRALVLSVFLLVTSFIGCSSEQEYAPSGFLGDDNFYSQMEYNSRYDVMEYIPDPYALAQYNMYIVPPVIVHTGSNQNDRKVNSLAEDLRRKIILALGNKYSHMNLPSKNTAVLRIALTDVSPGRALLNMGPSSMLGVIKSGGAAMEAEVIDSVTGKRVASVLDSQKGKKGGYLTGMKKWGNTNEIFQLWADNLRSRLLSQPSQAKASFGSFGK